MSRSGTEESGAPVDPIGSLVDDRYRVIELLGRGGMGSVYRATHVRLGRPVALKILNPELRRFPEINARFEREALATGRLDHPNCVGILDRGDLDDGTPYLVTEFVEGVELSDLLDRVGRLDIDRALSIARHALSGLAHAHAAGVVHRDIKPSNIVLVERDGDPDFVKLLDFGIAKLLGSALDDIGGEQLTQAGLSLGTPSYVSPEQALGQPLDARSDLYSLSVVLFEMLAGAPPFAGDDPLAVMSMHTTQRIPAIAEVAPGVVVPPEVEALVREGLARRAEARIASAGEFIARIDAIRERRSAPTDPAPGGVSSARPAGRWWVPLGIGLALGLALGVGLTSSGGAPEPLLASSEAADEVPPMSDIASEAARLLDAGEPERAVALLEARSGSAGADPHAQLVLGHAYAEHDRAAEAATAYRRAIEAAPALGRDATLRTNLTLWLDGSDADLAAEALALLARIARSAGDEDAARQLVDAASGHGTTETRQRAREVAAVAGLGERVDLLQSLTLDLEKGRRCKDRKEAVAALRALGDARAIPALRDARERLGKGGFLDLETVNYNWCLKKAAEEAISALEAR